MKRLFIELQAVSRVLHDNGVTDEQMRQVQQAMMQGQGDIIPGTGGLRKIRCGAAGRGKSGGVRIVFADYPDSGRTFWLFAYPKNVRENLSDTQREGLRKIKQALDHANRKGTSV